MASSAIVKYKEYWVYIKMNLSIDCSVSTSVNKVVKLWREWETIVASPFEEHGEQSIVSPLETPQLTSPLQTCKVSPLEGAEGCGLVAKMLRHIMPVKVVMIPMTVIKTGVVHAYVDQKVMPSTSS
jgi:hypothetical protein